MLFPAISMASTSHTLQTNSRVVAGLLSPPWTGGVHQRWLSLEHPFPPQVSIGPKVGFVQEEDFGPYPFGLLSDLASRKKRIPAANEMSDRGSCLRELPAESSGRRRKRLPRSCPCSVSRSFSAAFVEAETEVEQDWSPRVAVSKNDVVWLNIPMHETRGVARS